MSRRPLVLPSPLTLALLPAAASAADLVQTYELARAAIRNSPPPNPAASRPSEGVGAGARRAAAADRRPTSLQLEQPAAAATRSSLGTPTPINSHLNPTTAAQLRRQRAPDHLRPQQLHPPRAPAARSSQASDFELEAAGDALIIRTSAAYFNVLIAIETLAAAEAPRAALKSQFD